MKNVCWGDKELDISPSNAQTPWRVMRSGWGGDNSTRPFTTPQPRPPSLVCFLSSKSMTATVHTLLSFSRTSLLRNDHVWFLAQCVTRPRVEQDISMGYVPGLFIGNGWVSLHTGSCDWLRTNSLQDSVSILSHSRLFTTRTQNF